MRFAFAKRLSLSCLAAPPQACKLLLTRDSIVHNGTGHHCENWVVGVIDGLVGIDVLKRLAGPKNNDAESNPLYVISSLE